MNKKLKAQPLPLKSKKAACHIQKTRGVTKVSKLLIKCFSNRYFVITFHLLIGHVSTIKAMEEGPAPISLTENDSNLEFFFLSASNFLQDRQLHLRT